MPGKDLTEVRKKLEDGMRKAGDKVTARAERTLAARVTASRRGTKDGQDDNVREHGGNRFFFYKNATVVRLPSDPGSNSTVRIQRDKPDEDAIVLDASTFDLDEGFYVLTDGTIVLRVPEDGSKIDVIVQGKPDDPDVLADDGYNYRC